jgi:hypothetical protein
MSVNAKIKAMFWIVMIVIIGSAGIGAINWYAYKNATLDRSLASATARIPDQDSSGGSPSQFPNEFPNEFDEKLKSLGLNIYFANLHAHHFIQYRPSGKSGLSNENLGPGPCQIKGSFPEDDGRPCRNNAEKQNSFVGPFPDRTDYFKAACDYAFREGGLDILYITAHTKTGQETDADTRIENMAARHKMLAAINNSYDGKFYCGLGQEVSSISAGNHVNVFGQFAMNSSETKPLYFQAGAFNQLYSQIKDRTTTGEILVAQMNHPDVRSDLWFKSMSDPTVGKDTKKEKLNDYGVDDFAPVGCSVQKFFKNSTPPAGCEAGAADIVTYQSLKETFKNINAAANDSFKLIEVVGTGGATDNPTTDFRKVHRRVADDGSLTEEASELPDGIYDYIFYLAMGFKLSPTANQDNHHMNWGSATASRTGVIAANLEESNVVGALAQRRTFASEDQNAKILLVSNQHVMGEVVETTADTFNLEIGYKDSDENDDQANLKVYAYGENDELDISYRSPKQGVVKTLELKPDESTIRSGQMKTIAVPVKPGLQYFFVEFTQNKDQDKIWSAPFWVKK